MIETVIAGLTCGIATFYGLGDGFHGQTTANGERFDAYRWTAAILIYLWVQKFG